MLMTCSLLSADYADCSKRWIQLNGKEYCLGESELTFEDNRAYCQQLSADLIVLDKAERYTDLLYVLSQLSNTSGGQLVDVFIGTYQRQCNAKVDNACTWLLPFSGKWYWINDDSEYITPSHSSFWQILDRKWPYITGFNTITILEKNKQHYVVGSDNKTFAVDGFNAEKQFLKLLKPLCSRDYVKSPQSVVEENIRNNACCRMADFTTLFMFTVLWLTWVTY